MNSDIDNCHAAIRLLGQFTNNRFDIWELAGPSRKDHRQRLFTTLMHGTNGRKIPKDQCGIHVIRSAFYVRVSIAGNCVAEREDKFVEYCRAIVAQPLEASHD